MQKLEITHHQEVSEYVAEKDGTKTVMYVRKNSTSIVKERNGELLEVQTFGPGPMQAFREMYLKEHPLTDNERYKNDK